MKVIDSIANDIIHELKKLNLEPYIYHKAMTGSIYIKFKNNKIGSLRLGDHDGREKYRYRFNVRSDMAGTNTFEDRGVIRYYASPLDYKWIIERIKDRNKVIT